MPPLFSVKLVGFKSILDKLSKANAEDAVEDFKKGLVRVAIMIEGEARRNCVVDTGTLRRSITRTIPYLNAGKWQIDIGTNVEYAPFVEFGTGMAGMTGATKGNMIYDSAREAMTQMGYIYGAGKKRPNSPGMAARPFLFPAFEKYKDRIPELIMEAVVKRIMRKGQSEQ